MSQHSQTSRSIAKKTSTITKTTIISWITSILIEYSNKIIIQHLGDGQIYCRIINHYVPGTILTNRIIFNSKNQYEYCMNLKQFQKALCKLKISINFDIQKVSKRKFNENWALISSLHKYLQPQDKKNEPEDKKELSQEHNLIKSNQGSLKMNNIPQTVIQKTEIKSQTKEVLRFAKGSFLSAVDTVKEILLSNTHDTEKIRQIKMLFGVEADIKVEENEESIVRIID